MDDDLMEETPEGRRRLTEEEVQQLLAEYAMKRLSAGVNAFRVMAVMMVGTRYPSLVKMAQKRVDQLHTIEDSSTLCREIAQYFDEPNAQNEQKVRELLQKPRSKPKPKSI